MRNYITIFVTIFFLIGGTVNAQNPNLGTSGAQFLKIPVSARAAAMGGAYIGICAEASSVFWNPAGIANVKFSALHFSNTKWFDTFNVNAGAFVYSAGNFGTIAVSFQTLGMGEMEITTEAEPNGTALYFDAQDLALGVSYARHLTNRFRVGLTAKYIKQRIWNEVANGVAFDVGTQYQLPFNNLTIAMSMLNFGPDMAFNGPDLSVKYDGNSDIPNRLIPTRLETESYPLPLSFQFGIAIDLYRSNYVSARAAVDAVHPNDNQERIHLGTEISFYDRLFLRTGYRHNHDDEVYNMGFGVTAFISGVLLGMDYSYSMYDILPDVHQYSLGVNF